MALTRTQLAVVILIALQMFCAVFFVSDILADYTEAAPIGGAGFHLALELLASLSLVAAMVIEAGYVRALHLRQARLRQRLSLAGSAIEQIVEKLFEEWKLSAAERDVGLLLVKGLNISEIAAVRENAEGTIKAHLNAIYRKSGARSRADVLGLIVDAVMGRDARSADDGENRAPELMMRQSVA